MGTMSDEKKALGEQELTLLRFVTDRGGAVTVREMAAEFGASRGLARTTVLTVMERLRVKGYLARQKTADGSAWEYRPEQARSELLGGLVREFVAKSLGGSAAPVVAFLSDARNLTDQEKADLRAIVAGLEE